MSKHPKPGAYHPPTQPKQPGSEDKSTKRHVYIEPGVKIDLVDDLRKQQETAQGETNAHQKRQLLWTKITAFLVLVTAAIYFSQLLAMRETMRVGERAWIFINIAKPMQLENNRPMMATMQLVNDGKTPAKHLAAEFYVQFVPNGQSPKFEFSEKIPHHTLSAGVMFPKQMFDTYPTRLRWKGDSRTATEDDPLTESEYEQIRSGKAYAVTYGQVRFADAFGIDHWFNVCNWYSNPANPSIGFTAETCTAYNDIDDRR